MEYISWTLNVVGSLGDFKFHPRCKRLNLNHLMFADDLMLFCKADGKSARILKQSLDLYSASSGLYENASNMLSILWAFPITLNFKLLNRSTFLWVLFHFDICLCPSHLREFRLLTMKSLWIECLTEFDH